MNACRPSLTRVPNRAVFVHDLRAAVHGEVATEARGVLVAPRAVPDVVQALGVARAHGASVANADGDGAADALLDLGAHLHRIVRVAGGSRTIRAEGGARVGDVRAAAAEAGFAFLPHGFVPDGYTLARALDEGLLPAVTAAEIVTYGGRRLHLEAVGERDPLAEAVACVRDVGERNLRRIRARFAGVARAIAGYDLSALLPERGFNPARLLNGARGTLGIAVELRCALDEPVPHRSCALLAFPGIVDAAAQVPFVQSYGPAALYGCDAGFAGAEAFAAQLPAGRAWLIAEFAGDTAERAAAGAESLAEAASRRYEPVPCAVLAGPLPRGPLLAAAAASPADVLVSCEAADVAALLRDLTRAAAPAALTVYGDFGVPCVAVRSPAPLFDCALPDVVKRRGLVVDASGAGSTRFTRNAALYGPELAHAFDDVARCFDPEGCLNPHAR